MESPFKDYSIEIKDISGEKETVIVADDKPIAAAKLLKKVTTEAVPSPTLSEIVEYGKRSGQSNSHRTNSNYKHKFRESSLKNKLLKHVSYSSPAPQSTKSARKKSCESLEKSIEKVNDIEVGSQQPAVKEIVPPSPPIPSFLTLLPLPIAYKILLYLEVEEILKCALVSLNWYGIISNSNLWYNLCIQNGWHTYIPRNLGDFDWKVIFKARYCSYKNLINGSITRGSFTAHQGSANCIIVEDEVITAGQDGNVSIWQHQLNPLNDENVALSNENEKVGEFVMKTCKSAEKSFSFFDDSGELTKGSTSITALCYSHTHIIAGMWDGSMMMLNSVTFDRECYLPSEHNEMITSIIDNQDNTIVSCSCDQTIRIYTLNRYYKNGLASARIANSEYYTAVGKYSIKLTGLVELNTGLFGSVSHRNSFYFAGADGKVHYTNDISLDNQWREFTAHNGAVSEITICSDYLITGGLDKIVKRIVVWNLNSLLPIKEVNVCDIPRSVAIIDDALLIAGTNDVHLFSKSSGKLIWKQGISRDNSRKKIVKMSASPMELFLSCTDGTVLFWIYK